VDYSSQAVELSESVAKKMALNITYKVWYTLDNYFKFRHFSKLLYVKVWDLLGSDPCPGQVPFDVALDKGTYDAVGLSANGVEDRKTYVDKIHSILRPGGLLVITSCNYTEPELLSQFSKSMLVKYLFKCVIFKTKIPLLGFTRISRIPAPTFKFGGKEGSLVTSLIFKSIWLKFLNR